MSLKNEYFITRHYCNFKGDAIPISCMNHCYKLEIIQGVFEYRILLNF